jgi:hypothetical protein
VKEDGLLLFLRHTSPNHPVDTNLEEEGLIPKIVLCIGFELLPLLVCQVRGDYAGTVKVGKVRIPWCSCRLCLNCIELLAWYGVADGHLVLLLAIPV